MERKFTSFSFKLNSVILTIFVTTSLVFGLIIGWTWLKNLNEALYTNGLTIARKGAIEVDHIFDNAQCIGDVYADNFEITLSENSNPEIVRNQFQKKIIRLLQIEECVTGALLILSSNQHTETGEHIYYYNYVGGEKPEFHTGNSEVYEKMGWFQEAEQAKKPFWSSPVTFGKEDNGERSLLYVTPLFSAKNHFIGTLSIQISLDRLQDILRQSNLEGGHGASFLYNKKGELLTHPNINQKDSPALAAALGKMQEPQFVKKMAEMVSGKSGMLDFPHSSLYDNGVNLFYAPGDRDMFVALALPGDWITSRLSSLFYHLVIAFVLTLALIITIVMYNIKKLTRPLSRLSQTAKLIGEGKFETPIPDYHSNDEIGQLTRSFEEMQRDLIQYMHELKKSVEEKQLIAGEMNAAKKIQDGILPKLVTPFPECDFCLLDASLSPARGVGGDLYDFFYMDANHLALIIGDVSGKGVPAALFMAVTETLQRSISALLRDPAKIVTKLNKFLLNNNDADMFVTYFMVVIDVNTGRMTYCNAGHNPPYIRRKSGKIIKLEALHGLPLAISDEKYESSETSLEPGDLLFLYTDGVTEAFNPQDELYGDERLEHTIEIMGDCSPGELIKGVLSDVDRFANGREQADDITMLAVKRRIHPEIR